jgi:hypothetical protein
VVIAWLFGDFDETSARSDRRGAPLALHVEYPSRIQHQQGRPLLIEVRNESDAAVEQVAVEIDRGYIEDFDAGSFLPAPAEITPDAYVVKLGEIQPGDVRQIAADLKAKKVGANRARSGSTRAGASSPPSICTPSSSPEGPDHGSRCLLIPEIVSNGIQGNHYSNTHAIVGVSTLFVLVFVTSLLSSRSSAARAD